MSIRVNFNDQIDKFIEKFAKAFKNIESSNELIEYQGEDKRLQLQVEEIQKKYVEILRIFNNISSQTAQKKMNYIESIKSQMKNIEKKVKD